MFGPIFSTKMEEKTCKANKALFEKGALVGCNLFFSFWYWKTFCIYYHHIWQRYQSEYISEIDQITKVLKLCGTPTNETLSKITSEEVSSVWLPSNYFEIIQYYLKLEGLKTIFFRQSCIFDRCRRWTKRISRQSFLGRTLKVRIDWKACICKLLRQYN